MTPNSPSTSPTPVAVITGAARGIGQGIAQGFLAHGYAVALLDRDGQTLATTALALAAPQRLLAIDCDVSQADQVDAAFAVQRGCHLRQWAGDRRGRWL